MSWYLMLSRWMKLSRTKIGNTETLPVFGYSQWGFLNTGTRFSFYKAVHFFSGICNFVMCAFVITVESIPKLNEAFIVDGVILHLYLHWRRACICISNFACHITNSLVKDECVWRVCFFWPISHCLYRFLCLNRARSLLPLFRIFMIHVLDME